jgi:hypothetical protein
MKSVSLSALAFVYFGTPIDFVSLTVVLFGFLLNCAAAKALGSDRTYYGHELAHLPKLRITTFPYSWLSHPMLVGNIMAFGGTLINEQFRREWWALACAHVVLNFGLLVMETTIRPRRHGARLLAASKHGANTARCSIQSAVCVTIAGALLGVALPSCVTWSLGTLLAAVTGAAAAIHALVVFCSYSSLSTLSLRSNYHG